LKRRAGTEEKATECTGECQKGSFKPSYWKGRGISGKKAGKKGQLGSEQNRGEQNKGFRKKKEGISGGKPENSGDINESWAERKNRKNYRKGRTSPQFKIY